MISGIDGDTELVYAIGFAANKSHDDFNSVKSQLDNKIDEICYYSNAKSYRIWLTDSSKCWRRELATIVPYKGNRKTNTKPPYYHEIREYLMDKHEAIMSSHNEADDDLAIFALEYRDEVVVSSRDKDLKNHPGWHYDSLNRTKFYIDERQAQYNYWGQVITGDRIDNVPGLWKADEGAVYKAWSEFNNLDREAAWWAYMENKKRFGYLRLKVYPGSRNIEHGKEEAAFNEICKLLQIGGYPELV